MSTIAYNCPCCGAPLKFSGASGKLECAACGNSYDTEAIEAMNPAFADAGPEFDLPKETFGAEESAVMQAYLCENCGAELMTEGFDPHLEIMVPLTINVKELEHQKAIVFQMAVSNVGMAVKYCLCLHDAGLGQQIPQAVLDPLIVSVGHQDPDTPDIIAQGFQNTRRAAVTVAITGYLVDHKMGILF